MTRVAVVAYPAVQAFDRAWMESIRAQHDPQFALIRAHFTLVFPAEHDPDVIIPHVADVCRASQPIAFSAGQTQATRENAGQGGHVFLVPDVGRIEMATLHDRMCSGVLHGDRQGGTPFVPHITLATLPNLDRCLALAKELAATGRVVKGTVDRVDVVTVTADRVESLAVLQLRGPGSP